MNDLGKPDAGKLHVRFDEEALETGDHPMAGRLTRCAERHRMCSSTYWLARPRQCLTLPLASQHTTTYLHRPAPVLPLQQRHHPTNDCKRLHQF